MPRLAQLARRQKRSRLRDALVALALVVGFGVPAAAVTYTGATATGSTDTAAEMVDDHADHTEADTCAPTSVSVEC